MARNDNPVKRSIFLTPVELGVWEKLIDGDEHFVTDLKGKGRFDRKAVCRAVARFADAKLCLLDGPCENDATVVKLTVDPTDFYVIDVIDGERPLATIEEAYLDIFRAVEMKAGKTGDPPGFIPTKSGFRMEFREWLKNLRSDLNPGTVGNKVFSYRSCAEGHVPVDSFGIVMVLKYVTCICWPGMEPVDFQLRERPPRRFPKREYNGRKVPLRGGEQLFELLGSRGTSAGDQLPAVDRAPEPPPVVNEPGQFETFELPIFTAEGLKTLHGDELGHYAARNLDGRRVLEENTTLMEAELEHRRSMVEELDRQIEAIGNSLTALQEQMQLLATRLKEIREERTKLL